MALDLEVACRWRGRRAGKVAARGMRHLAGRREEGERGNDTHLLDRWTCLTGGFTSNTSTTKVEVRAGCVLVRLTSLWPSWDVLGRERGWLLPSDVELADG